MDVCHTSDASDVLWRRSANTKLSNRCTCGVRLYMYMREARTRGAPVPVRHSLSLTLGGALRCTTVLVHDHHITYISYGTKFSSNLYESESADPVTESERDLAYSRACKFFFESPSAALYPHPNPESRAPVDERGVSRVWRCMCMHACLAVPAWQRGPWSFGNLAHRTHI